MQATEQRALLGLALMAAFADGDKADAEREEVRRIATTLGEHAAALNYTGLVQDVLLGRLTLPQVVADLPTPALRQLGYELAVCVCDADGRCNDTERAFLQRLKPLLALSTENAAAADAVQAQADGLAQVTDAPQSVTPVTPIATTAAATTTSPAGPVVDAAALDKSILNYAVLCGALELLPQSWASMAIIPLQVKMVYAVGVAHGVQLDQGHIKEFIAAAGVGLTSQYLEQFGRKLLGGLLGSVAGGIGRGVGRAGAGMAMSFATTYALGQLAKRYYAGGRQMNTAVLRDTFQSLLGPAKDMQQQWMPQIQERARTLDAKQVLNMVRSA